MAKDTKIYEGWRDEIYLDSEGYETIGYGHKLTEADKKSGKYSGGITKKQGEALYNKDRSKHNAQFYKANPQFEDAPTNVKAALEDLSYNMGPAFLDKFPTAARHLNAGEYSAAGDEFANSKYATQVGQRAFDNAALLGSKATFDGKVPTSIGEAELASTQDTRLARLQVPDRAPINIPEFRQASIQPVQQQVTPQAVYSLQGSGLGNGMGSGTIGTQQAARPVQSNGLGTFA